MKYLIARLLPLLLSLLLAGASPAPEVQELHRCAVMDAEQHSQLVALGLDVWTHRIRLGGNADIRVKNAAERNQLMKLGLDCTFLRELGRNGLAKRGGTGGGGGTPPSSTSTTTAKTSSTTTSTSKTTTTTGPTPPATVPDPSTDSFFSNYQSSAAIAAKMQAYAAAAPRYATFVPAISSSKMTNEGRNISAIIVTDNQVSNANKKLIWWNGGQHAREWISPATVMFLTGTLLNQAGNSPVSTYLSEAIFVITPNQNPDGYEYTRASNGDRLWRKNRRNNGDSSFGVDLNRNWDDHWGYAGASTDTSSDVYQGTKPFSEPETKTLSDYIASFKPIGGSAGIDFHSYSQLVLRNWGWTSTVAKNEAVLKQLGDGMASAIKSQSGVSYTSEPGASLYPAAGCTDDWMTTSLGMAGFTIELRDTGSHGFELPASQIVPTGQEIWAAMKFFINFVLTHTIPPDVPPPNQNEKCSDSWKTVAN
ncbi:hypothetical protein HK101_010370 [Irineochytrium annulatum]|nr:hypothetical protein HK101_010370 [Irineochytrium annulatum]